MRARAFESQLASSFWILYVSNSIRGSRRDDYLHGSSACPHICPHVHIYIVPGSSGLWAISPSRSSAALSGIMLQVVPDPACSRVENLNLNLKAKSAVSRQNTKLPSGTLIMGWRLSACLSLYVCMCVRGCQSLSVCLCMRFTVVHARACMRFRFVHIRA